MTAVDVPDDEDATAEHEVVILGAGFSKAVDEAFPTMTQLAARILPHLEPAPSTAALLEDLRDRAVSGPSSWSRLRGSGGLRWRTTTTRRMRALAGSTSSWPARRPPNRGLRRITGARCDHVHQRVPKLGSPNGRPERRVPAQRVVCAAPAIQRGGPGGRHPKGRRGSPGGLPAPGSGVAAGARAVKASLRRASGPALTALARRRRSPTPRSREA